MQTQEQRLRDECLELEARLLGKRLELAMCLGKRDEAVQFRQAMENVIRERRDAAHGVAEAEGMDFFSAAAVADSKVMHAETLNG